MTNGKRETENGKGRLRSWVRVLAVGIACLIGAACRGERVDLRKLETLVTPAEHQAGEASFAAHCRACHGPRATGTPQGPPLVDRIYQPGHHGDAAFLLAVQRGVSAHHWRFGNMPPVPGVTESEVRGIVGYVRWLQRQVGIE